MKHAHIRLVALLATLSIVAATARAGEAKPSAQHEWEYGKEHGPAHWGDLDPEFAPCKVGQRQSPIDIRETVKAELPPIEFDYHPSPLRIVDNGHTIMASYASGSSIKVGADRYELKQLHFHRPSENWVRGKRYAMEAHLVHADASGRLAVVALLLETGRENALVRELWNDIPREKGKENRNRVLQGMVLERTRELAATQDATILSMATLAETRDPETGRHLRRTQGYVRALALELRDHPRFCDQLDDHTIELLFKSAPLHDIGKVGVPDRILRKPARLTPEEYEDMKKHTLYGYEAIVATEALLAEAGAASVATSFLRFAREVARSHHEKWDGSGYPDGLRGDAIPLSARLMAVADVYDAVTSKRVYKPGFTHAETTAEIMNGRGSYFDADVVDAFRARGDEFMKIARSHAE